MRETRKAGFVAALVLMSLVVFGSAVASPPPLPSSFYGTIDTAGFQVPSGTLVSAWVGGVKLAEAPVFLAEGVPSFVLDVAGDIADTTISEGGHEGEAIAFKVGGAPAPQPALWHTGTFVRLELSAAAGPDLAVSVDDGATSVFPGGVLSYTLTVRNPGAQRATGVLLRDTLFPYATLDSSGGGTVQDGVVTWPAFDLEPGASTTRIVSLQIATTLPLGTSEVTNEAAVAHDGAQGLDPNASNDSATDRDTLRVPPDFAIADADLVVTPAHPQPGNTVNVSLTVRNPGFVAGTGLAVIYNGPPFTGAVVGSRTLTLAQGASQTLQFSFVAGPSTLLVSAVMDPDNEVIESDEGNNVARRFLADVPDLAIGIDNFLLVPSSPRAGDSVAVGVTVRNGGRSAASNVAVEVFDGDPDEGAASIYSGTIPAIPMGGNRTLSFTWSATEGPHRLTALADRANAILELSEENNRAVRSNAVPRGAGADLTVASVDVSGLPQSSQTLVANGTVRATVANGGDAPAASPFDVRLFEDRDGDGHFSTGDRELARQTVPAGLGVGSTAALSFSVQGTLEFFHPLLWVEADAEARVAELLEDNNLGAGFGVCETIVAPSVAPTVEKWFLPGVEAETAPVVLQLTDDNADGAIDSRDIPDVTFQTEDAAGPAVLARSGVDGSAIWTVRSTIAEPLGSRLAHVAAADLDGDGVAEVVVGLSNGRLMALDHRGQKVWVSPVIEGPSREWSGSVAVGDLDGDGVPEIVAGRTVLSNAGLLIAKGTANRGQNYNYYGPLGVPVAPGLDQSHALIADVDLDGRNEVVAGDTLYRLSGNQLTVVWDKNVADNLMQDGFTAVANLDGDPEAEIVYVSSGFVMVLNHDGSVAVPQKRVIPFSPIAQPTMWAGAPTIADLDGDGAAEILIAGDTELVALRANLSTYWRAPIDELAGMTAATVFDLDGDGHPEVIFLDQSKLYILDGRTGSVLYSRSNSSKTATEYPVVADLDNDGQAEILVPSNKSFAGDTTTQGLHVLGNPGWRGTRPIWNQYSYHVTNVQLDGTVPSPELPSWRGDNTYRVNESLPARSHLRPNATIGLPRVATPNSAGATVRLRVGNGGRGVLPAGVAIVLYAGSPAAGVVAAEAKTGAALRPGDWQDLAVQWQQSGPAGAQATAVVDPVGRVEECDESDNTVAFQITETLLPDLAIPAGGVTLPSTPVAGQRAAISVKVENRGTAQASASRVVLYDGPPSLGVRVGEGNAGVIAPGAFATVAALWDTLGAAGARTLYAVADGDDAVIELDEANNQGSLVATLTAPTKPDLAAEGLVIDPGTATVGTPVRLAVEAANRGTSLAGSFEVAFRVNNSEVVRVTSAGPFAAGERRIVEHTLATLSLSGHQGIEVRLDPANTLSEQNETNNSVSGSLELGSGGATASVTTERVSYGSNDTATVTLNTQNTGSAAAELGVRITIQNAAGALVSIVSDQTATLPPGTTTAVFTWSTGATPAGTYAVVADISSISSGGVVIARASAPFSILPDRSASAQLFADHDRYEAVATATFTGRVRNTGVNQPLADLQAKLTIGGPAGVVSTSTQSIALLSQGAEAALSFVWPVGSSAPGAYTARLEVRDLGGAGALLAFASADLAVLDSAQSGAGLAADLTVSPSVLGSGGSLLARWSTRNGGNADLSNLRLRIKLVRVVDDTSVAAQEIPWPLDRNQQRDGSLGTRTAGFQEGDYSAELEALVPGGVVTLARAPFSVQRGVSIADVRVAEGNFGASVAAFQVALSSASPEAVTVGFATADGTARADEDYTGVSGTLTFAPGETSKTVSVSVLGDLQPEAEEVFLLTLSDPAGAALGDAQALATLVDEEGCPGPNLLANGDAEEGAVDADLPEWTAASGVWNRRFADPLPLAGGAAFSASLNDGEAELWQDVDLSAFASRIDAGLQPFLFDGSFQSAPGAQASAARVIIEYRDAANSAILASFDTGALASPGLWSALVDARTAPAGARWARVRLRGVSSGAAGGSVSFDRLGLRSLGTPVLTVADSTVAEGNGGGSSLRFDARLSCPAPAPLSVTYATVDGSAHAGSDYGAVSGTLSFAAGTSVETLDVAVQGDLVDEQDETLFLDLDLDHSSGAGLVVLRSRATGTIADDDGPVALSVADAFVDEGDAQTSAARFAVRLSAPSGKPVTASYASVAGTASSPQDFTPATGTVTFAPGETEREVVVPVVGDRLDEEDETLTLHLASPLNASLADADGVATIVDDDEAQLSIGDASVLEGNGEAVSLVFPVALSLPADRSVRVAYATVGGTAVEGTDYQAASGTLTLPAGTTAATISVPVLGNQTEQADRSLLVRLAAPVVATLARPEAIGTIRDDDGTLISIQGPTSDDVVITEGDAGTKSVTFNVTVTNNAAKTVSVAYSTADGTALASGDYTAASGTLTFPPGTSVRTITVPLVGDLTEEASPESFEVVLSNPVGGSLRRAAASATVLDNDGWSLNGTEASLETVPSCVFLVRSTFGRGSAWKKQAIDLTRSFDQTYQVYLGANDGGADGLTFALQSVGLGALGENGGNLGLRTITPSVAVELDTFRNNWDPDFDHVSVDVQGNVTHPGFPGTVPPAGSNPVPVTPDSGNIEDGHLHTLRVIWNAGAKALDVHFDGQERLVYGLDMVTSIFGGNPTVYYGLTSGSGNVTNDHYFCPTVQCADSTQATSISVGDVRLKEGDAGTASMIFPVTLSCPRSQPVTVAFGTADGTATAGTDYTAVSGTLTFQPGETSKDVVVPILGESLAEADETLFVNLSGLSGAAQAVIRYAQGTGTILSDDAGFRVAATRMLEGNAQADQVFDLSLAQASPVPVSFSWQTGDGTALAGSDYVAASGSVTFQPGELHKLVTVRILGDSVAEADETFAIRFTNVVNNPSVPASVAVTLLDDDGCTGSNLLLNPSGEDAPVAGQIPGWTRALGSSWNRFSSSFSTVDGSFFLRAFNEPAAELRQDVNVASLSSLIATGGQRFLFQGYMQTFIGEAIGDSGRFRVEFRDAANANVLGIFDSGDLVSPGAYLRISDLITAPPGTSWIRVRLQVTRVPGATDNVDVVFDALSLRAYGAPEVRVADASGAEGNSGQGKITFAVTMQCPGSLPVRVDYLTADGTARAGTDYLSTFGTLTFAPGETVKAVEVPEIGDTLSEGNETFLLNLTNSQNGGLGRAQATGMILDDESSVSIANATVAEGSSGQTQMQFTVSLSKASTVPVQVGWSTADGTASAGNDYVASSGTVQFDPGQTAKTVSVPVVGDTVGEPDETLFVRLTHPVLVTLGTTEAIGTIQDDDVLMSIGDTSVIEGNTGTTLATFKVTLSRPSVLPVSVAYQTQDRTATAGQDYSATNQFLGFNPGQTERILSVQVIGDTLKEPGEVFAMVLSNPANATLLDGEGIATIVDDDDCTSPNLLRNPGAEEGLVRGLHPGWTTAGATVWQTASGLVGANSFYAPNEGELRQDVDVSVYGARIDAGTQRFSFQGWVQTFATTYSGRIVLEMRDADNRNPLGSFDSGPVTGGWQRVVSPATVPPGTRWIRVRLLSFRGSATATQVFFDALELRSVGTPVFSIDDRSVTEGNTGTVTMPFAVSLSCPQAEVVSVDYASDETGAQDGLDYAGVSGTLSFQPGQTSLPIPLTVFGDTRTEYDETLAVLLSQSSGPLLLFPLAKGTILDDDRPAAVTLTGTLRDMQESHPDFEKEQGGDLGIVQPLLGADKKPVYASATRTLTTHGKAAFDQWFRDVPGVNQSVPYSITLTPTADPRVYRYSNLAFFPLDSPGQGHNFHMTYEIHTRFLYSGNEVFRFYGDDDIWVFLNGKLALDMGGVHLPYQDTIDLDLKAAELGMVKGGVYDFDIFWAERHTTGSSFQMETTLLFGATDPGVLQFGAPTYEATESGGMATISVVRTRGDSSPVSVTYSTADGSATAPGDYAATTGTLAFNDGERGPKTFVVPIADDNTIEPAESLTLRLSAPTGGAELSTPSTAVLSLLDDDSHPELAASKTATLANDRDGDGRPSPGDSLRYEIRIENRGSAPATSVTLDDPLPANTSVVAGSVTTTQGAIASESPVRVDLGTLAPVGSAIVRFEVTIAPAVRAGVREVRNQGVVGSTELPALPTDDPSLGGAADPTVTAITAAPALVAEKTATLAVDADGDGHPSPGDTLRYQVTVRNRGNTSATSVAVDDPVPASTALVAGSVAVSQGSAGTTAPQVHAALGEIEAGGTATLTFRVRIAKPVPAGVRQLSNQATVTSAELSPLASDDPETAAPADATVTPITAAPVLVVEKIATLITDVIEDGVASPGDTLLYRVSVANHGNTAATGVVVRDAIPPGTALDAASVQASQGTIVTSEPIEVALGEIAADETATLTFRVQVADPFPPIQIEVSNQARVASAELPEVASDDPSTADPADATRTSVYLPVALSIGDLEVTESGSPAELAVRLSQPSNREARIVATTLPGTALAGGDFTATSVALVFAPGETEKVVSVPIVDDAVAEEDETFRVQLTQPVGATLSRGAAVVTILDDDRRSELAATKTATLANDRDGDGQPSPGDVLLYEIRIENRGSAEATGVTLDDPIPAHTSVVAGSATTTQGAMVSESPLWVYLGALAPGGSATVRFEVAIAPAVPAGVREVRNQGVVGSVELPALPTDDPSLGGAADPTVTAITAAPVLVAEKTATLFVDADHDGHPSPGDTLQYQVTVRNRGNSSATSVAVDDPVPSTTTLVAGSVAVSQGSASTTASHVHAALGEIEADGTASLTFRVRIAKPVPAGVRQVSNQATVTSAELAALASDDPETGAPAGPTVTPIAAAPVLSLEKTATLIADTDGDGIASPGDSLLYRITLANQGNTSATGVVLRDAIPEGTLLEPGSLQTSQGTISTFDPIAVDVGEIGADETATVTFRVSIASPFPTARIEVSNQARATSAELPELPSNDPATPATSDASKTAVFIPAQLAAGDVSVAEGAGSAQVVVQLSPATNREVRVVATTASGTASAGSDYTAVSTTLVFAPGETQKLVSIPIANDLLDEADEAFTLVLSGAQGATVADPEAVITIRDDDDAAPVGSLTVDDVLVVEGDSGTTDARLKVRLAAALSTEARVSYATLAGTATSGTDFQAASGTLVFAPGETEKPVTVKVVGDLILEADETFALQLSSPVGATIADDTGEGTIVDDESCPSPNLIVNPGAEQSGQGSGCSLYGWRSVAGSQWQARGGTPVPAEGSLYFYAGSVVLGELAQDIPVSTFAPSIDTGTQSFAFEGKLRSLGEQPSDTARIVVEYRNSANAVALQTFDSGQIASPLEWRTVSDLRNAPIGTRWVRIRLIADRFKGSNDDGYFDALSLRALRMPALAIGDVSTYEGSSASHDAVFNVSLSCPIERPASVSYSTADGTALSGSDYQATSGSVSFAAGETVKTLRVPVFGDRTTEGSETFLVNLGTPSPAGYAAVADGQGVGTILEDDACSRSPGYWKTHTSVWQLQSLTVGGRSYTASQMLTYLQYGGTDASTKLMRQVVTTALNLASGSDPSVQPIYAQADAFLVGVPPGSNPQGSNKTRAEQLKDQLEAHNDRCGS